MNGFSKLSIISFLMLLLVGAVYFNSQVQFNPVSARWEINEDYQIRDEISVITSSSINYLEFDGINDYVLLDNRTASIFDGSNYLDMIFDIVFEEEDSLFAFNGFIGSGSLGFRVGIDSNGDIAIESRSRSGGNNNSININYHLNTYERYLLTIRFDYQNEQIITTVNDNVVDTSNVTYNDNYLNGSSSPYPDSLFATFVTSDNNNIPGKLYSFNLNNGNTEVNYNIDEATGTILNDSIGNNDATIHGATWEQDLTTIQVTSPGINSYQVFENIRNNAPTVNPLSFMDTIITIPQKMVTYTDTFFSWIGFNYRDNILEPASEVSSELADTYKWYYNIFEWVRGFGE